MPPSIPFGDSAQAHACTARERLRRGYLPRKVRVLFVGESPPAGGTFFYAADSGLYRATRDAFYDALPQLDRSEPFLDAFSRLGCYLEDLCDRPVNDKPPAERLQLRREGEARLARTLKELHPHEIVVLLKAIVPNVRRALVSAGMDDLDCRCVTYPSRWHRHRIAYRRDLVSILAELRVEPAR